MKKKPEPATISAMFPADGKVQPKGFKELTVGETVAVMVTGTVKGIEDNADEWIPGKRVRIDLTGFEVKMETKPMSIKDAIAETKATA